MSHSNEGNQQTANRLINETSPYLLQHAHNPVDWYAWGPEAFQKAKEEDKPIFLSIGYSSCHWCHVMERESFDNPQTAEILNQLFISIKVDREERPDIDEIYMQAAQILTGAGGWPLSVFLDHDLRPFYAGTYFPPEDAYGRPGFPRILVALASAFQDRKDEVNASAEDLASAINQSLTTRVRQGQVGPDVILRAVEDLKTGFDPVWGGFGEAPKFPPVFAVQLLLRHYQQTKDQDAYKAAVETLEHMCDGGIFDHIGGGFHRYSTDREWLVPHFEKMLYDNALMLLALTEAWQVTKQPVFKQTVERTIEFIHREMTDAAGGFYSALDADSEGEEGKYYVWRPSEVLDVLGKEDGEAFCSYYGISPNGNFEQGTSIPRVSASVEAWATLNQLEPDILSRILAGGRTKLLHAREQRVRPMLDDKVITSWNALMIRSLAYAGRVFGRNDWTASAVSACQFVLGRVRLSDGMLAHTWRDGKSKGAAYQDDYATLIQALVELYQATFDEGWIKYAQELAATMKDIFWDGEAGGYFLTQASHDTPIARSKSPTDGVTPSGNSAAANVMISMGRLTGDKQYIQDAEKTIEAFGGFVSQVPTAFDNLLIAALVLHTPSTEIVIQGQGTDGYQDLLHILNAHYLPTAVIAGGDAKLAVLEGKSAGAATVWVCKNFACKQPVQTLEELSSLLAEA